MQLFGVRCIQELWLNYKRNPCIVKQAEAEVVPSSSLVEVEVEVGVEVEVDATLKLKLS